MVEHVAIKTSIDDFRVLVREQRLLQQLPNLFHPKVAVALDDAMNQRCLQKPKNRSKTA